MKKIFLMLSLVIALGFQSFAQNNNVKEDKEKGEYEIITENRNLPEFENLNITGRFKVVLHQTSSQTVSVVAPDKYLWYVETVVDHNALNIKMKEPKKEEDKNFFDRLKTKYNDYLIRQPIEVHIGVNYLKQIVLDGASLVETESAFEGKELYINLSGASKANLEFTLSDLSAVLSGATKLEMKGQTDNFQLDGSGAAAYDGVNMKSKNVTVSLSGASKAEVYATDNFDAKLTGASTVICSGNPKKVHQTSSRASKIVIK